MKMRKRESTENRRGKWKRKIRIRRQRKNRNTKRIMYKRTRKEKPER